MRYVLIVPTFNPGLENWKHWVDCVQAQSLKPEAVVVVDSGSSDDTKEFSMYSGFDVMVIDKNDFDHGGTRNDAVRYAVKKYDGVQAIVFLTQDAYLEGENAVKNLLKALSDDNVAVAYGRQLPAADANPIAAHARRYNYRNSGRLYSFADCSLVGIGAVFCSNSFSVYRARSFLELGGFSEKNILGEDMLFACKALKAGMNNAYVADAVVCHSHNYSVREEFCRYFDTGVFHSLNQDHLAVFAGVGGRGLDYIKSEIGYLFENRSLCLLVAPFYWLAKFLGYSLGRAQGCFPLWFNRALSMHKSYWNTG